MYGKCECCVMHMLYVCVLWHPVAVLNAEFCMTCSLLMLVEERRPYRRGILQICLVGSHECLLMFTPPCCSECFYDL